MALMDAFVAKLRGMLVSECMEDGALVKEILGHCDINDDRRSSRLKKVITKSFNNDQGQNDNSSDRKMEGPSSRRYNSAY
ncbi:hypothetical protein ACHAW5_010481 [Stephanodiscus triporus]|uniref:Uncharacterized protein n=1 Tax=Stephanodiscus triporus TaxID=2934178 RepID=A0ABD3NEM0_9STRA